MYTLLTSFQSIGIIILILEILYVLKQRPSSLTSLFLMFTICSFINSLGYLLEMHSTSLGESLLAIRFTYFGKVYVSLLMLLFIVKYCAIRLSKYIIYILFCFHTVIAFLVLFSDYTNLYYTSATFTSSGLFPHVVLSHGIFYYIYGVTCIIYLLLIPLICIFRYRQVSNKKEKHQILVLMLITIVPLAGYTMFLSGITHGYDITAAAYVISSITIFLTFIKTGFFDTIELAKDSVLDNLDNGIVVLDNANRLLYFNQIATDIFPELAKPSTREIIDYLFGLVYSRENYIKNKRVYSARIQVVYSKRVVRGKMIVLNDITDSYNYTRNLEAAVADQTEQLKYMQSTVITSLASIIEARDGVTGQHVKRTSAYVRIVTHALKTQGCYPDELTDAQVDNIIQAAPLHDIGKIAIPDSILCKPARLTPEEFEIIKTHPAIGANMIEEILKEVEHDDYLKVARDVANYHHEKWDGSGYPCGLKGYDIPLSARIMAITDVFEALISERPYKKGYSYEKSIEIIKEGSGQHFDPVIVDVFLSVIEDIKRVG